MAVLELDQRRQGARDQQKSARDTPTRSRLDGAIHLKEVGVSSDPREAIALLRYRIVAAATDPRLAPAERGQLVREFAAQAYDHPDGSRYTYSRGTLDRWCVPTASRAWTGYGHHRAPISARCVATRNCWRRPASCARNCRRVRLHRLPPSSKRAMACAFPNAPFGRTSVGVVSIVPR